MEISTMTISYTVEENREEHREREAVRAIEDRAGRVASWPFEGKMSAIAGF
jgi:hypothetical protein